MLVGGAVGFAAHRFSTFGPLLGKRSHRVMRAWGQDNSPNRGAHPAPIRRARLRSRECRLHSLLGKDEPPPSACEFRRAIILAPAFTGSARSCLSFHDPTAVAAKFHSLPHALPFLPPCEGAAAGGTGHLGQVRFLHAFHGFCDVASVGGFDAFISRRESRNSFFGADFAGRGFVRSIFRTRPSLPEIRSAMSDASGRFFQYFLGISPCIARTLSRAGLKMLR